MKKVFLLLILAVATITLFGCNSSEYKVDGEFLAYEVGVHRNAPMVTSVTVTIENGKIVGYNIDARQGKATRLAGDDGILETEDDKWAHSWNEKTKKELGNEYGMKAVSEIEKEWFEQAAAIEAFLLENGVDSVETDDESYITNITGVSMKDGGYTQLAAAALELAKEGKFQAIHTSNDDLTVATMIVDSKGNFTELLLDVLQGRPDGETFTWRDKTKQELGFEYGMVERGGATLEWFEQAELITDYITENGWTMNGEPSVTGVSITTEDYFAAFDKLFGFAGDSVK